MAAQIVSLKRRAKTLEDFHTPALAKPHRARRDARRGERRRARRCRGGELLDGEELDEGEDCVVVESEREALAWLLRISQYSSRIPGLSKLSDGSQVL